MTRIILQLVSLLLGAVLLFAPGQTGPAVAEALAPSATMEISFQGELITAELVDAPLIDVLQRLKQEFGFKAHFHGDLTELITLSITSMSLKKCLRLLTANHSLSVATRQTTELPEEDAAKQIAEIWVLSRSTTSKVVNIPSAAPGISVPDVSDNEVKTSVDSLEQAENAEQENVSPEEVVINQDVEGLGKRQTIKNLAAIGDPDSVMAMAEFSRDADKEVRQLAVNGIGSIQSEESTRVLGRVFLDESDPEIRKIALSALGQRKSDPTTRAILEGALNDADEEVKAMAEQLLAQ